MRRSSGAAIEKVVTDEPARQSMIDAGYEEAQSHSTERQWRDVRRILEENVAPDLLRPTSEALALTI